MKTKILLSLLFIFTLTACDGDDSGPSGDISEFLDDFFGPPNLGNDDEDTTPPVLDQNNDININEVVFLDADVRAWAQTASLNASVNGGELRVPYSQAQQWPASTTAPANANANVWVIANIDGTWYGATFEWLRFGQQAKAFSAIRSTDGYINQSEFDGWEVTSGETLGIMVSTPARNGQRTINERSNISTVVAP